MPERIGRYKLLREVGQGGMGIVYAAQDEHLQRTVAVKVLLQELRGASPQLARFEREGRAVACLQHANIVRVFDVGRTERRAYMVMEFVEGESLADRLKRNGPMESRAAARLALNLARALHHAHGEGILHRDLKPANVLLTTEGEPKITDFGLAKSIAGPGGDITQALAAVGQPTGEREFSLTATGQLLGTPAYMSPEQARGRKGTVDLRADVYSLGATLYEALTGFPPVEGENLVQVMTALLQGEIKPLRRRRPDLDSELDRIVMRCLERDPDERYPSAMALAQDLSAFLRPAAPVARVNRPAMVALALVPICLLLMALAVSLGSASADPEVELAALEGEGARSSDGVLEASAGDEHAPVPVLEAVIAPVESSDPTEGSETRTNEPQPEPDGESPSEPENETDAESQSEPGSETDAESPSESENETDGESPPEPENETDDPAHAPNDRGGTLPGTGDRLRDPSWERQEGGRRRGFRHSPPNWMKMRVAMATASRAGEQVHFSNHWTSARVEALERNVPLVVILAGANVPVHEGLQSAAVRDALNGEVVVIVGQPGFHRLVLDRFGPDGGFRGPRHCPWLRPLQCTQHQHVFQEAQEDGRFGLQRDGVRIFVCDPNGDLRETLSVGRQDGGDEYQKVFRALIHSLETARARLGKPHVALSTLLQEGKKASEADRMLNRGRLVEAWSGYEAVAKRGGDRLPSALRNWSAEGLRCVEDRCRQRVDAALAADDPGKRLSLLRGELESIPLAKELIEAAQKQR